MCTLTLKVTACVGVSILNNPHPIDHRVSLFCRETGNINRAHQNRPSDEGGQRRGEGSREEEKGREDGIKKGSSSESVGEGAGREDGLEVGEEKGGTVAESEEVGRQSERVEHGTPDSGGQVPVDVVDSEEVKGEGRGESVKEEAGDKVEEEEGQEDGERKGGESEPKESLRPEETKREVEPPAKCE